MNLAVYLGFLLLGLVVGSYLNSWMWRVFNSKKKLGKRSVCVHCRKTLVWYENIPLISFIFLRGKCSGCGKPIPRDYFLVELSTGILFAFVAYYHLNIGYLDPLIFFRDLFIIAVLVVVFVYDYKYKLVISGLVWSGALVALVLNYFAFNLTPFSMVMGIVIGGGFFFLKYIVSAGRWIGGGDVRLGVMMGALLGWPVVLVTLFIAYVLGALSAIPLLVSGRGNLKTQVPFGTFLAAATFIGMFWGERIIGWYLDLINF